MASPPPSVDKQRFYALLKYHVNAYPRSLDSEVLRAIRDGDLSRLMEIVDRLDDRDGAKLAAMTMNGYGLLHVACHFDNREVCKYLVEELNFDVNAGDISGVTPLSCAALFGEEAVTRYLMEHGSDPNKEDHRGCTALHNAAQNGNKEVMHLLLSGGARPDIAISHGTPLHVAASYGNTAAVKILLDYNANPNWSSKVSDTPLVNALTCTRYGLKESDSLECVKLLVEAGADVNSANPNTALVVATICGLTKCIDYLLNAGADADIPDTQGHLPIQIAASIGMRSLVEMLLPYTSPIRTVMEWSTEGIIAHEKLRCSTPKVHKRSATSNLVVESPSMGRNIKETGGAFTECGKPQVYTPQPKRSKTSATNRFSSPRRSSGSMFRSRRSHSAQSKTEKSQTSTTKAKRCKRILQYSFSSESSDNSNPSSTRPGIVTLRVYAKTYSTNLRESVRVPFQNATRRMTRRVPKLILRASFGSLSKQHSLQVAMNGCFNSDNYIVDLLDNTVNMQDVAGLLYTDIGGRKDRHRFVTMVKEEVFAGEDLPDDVFHWLQHIGDEKDPWDSSLLVNHIYMLDSRQAYGMFMSFCSTIHGLRTNKIPKYQALRNCSIFDKYLDWDYTFEFLPLNQTKGRINPDTGLVGYDPDIMGLIWLFRCCWQHKAQKFPHLLVAVVLGEEVSGLISDVQKALHDAGIDIA